MGRILIGRKGKWWRELSRKNGPVHLTP
jgi:hypothetical protein